MSNAHPPSYRYTAAAYWWIASELVRRHPKLELFESYIQDGFYDMITLRGTVSDRQIHVDFNRPGSIHVHPDHIGFMNAGDVMLSDDAHWAVKRIEEVAGLVPGAKAPSSSARVITLRLMARFLNSVVNDKSSWDIRMITEAGDGPSLALLPSALEPNTPAPFPAIFPAMKDFHSFMISSEFPNQLYPGRLWGLQRDGQVVAIFDTKGVLHTLGARTSVGPLYDRLGRNVTQTMVATLGPFLP